MSCTYNRLLLITRIIYLIHLPGCCNSKVLRYVVSQPQPSRCSKQAVQIAEEVLGFARHYVMRGSSYYSL